MRRSDAQDNFNVSDVKSSIKIGSRGLHVATSVGRKQKKNRNKANLKGKQLNCLVSQPIKNRPLRGHEVTRGKYRSAKTNESIPCQQSSHLFETTSRKKLIEMTIEPVELRISISPHFKASTKIDLCYVRNVALYCK